MNEFLTNLDKSGQAAEDWISTSSDAVESAVQEAGDDLSSVMERGREFYKTVRKRVGKEVDSANAVLHKNPYSAVLAGLCVGALFGCLAARQWKCRYF